MSTVDTTDSEDSPRPLVQQGAQASASGPQPSQLAVVGGSYPNLSPMIIMNNVLLKQVQDCLTQLSCQCAVDEDKTGFHSFGFSAGLGFLVTLCFFLNRD